MCVYMCVNLSFILNMFTLVYICFLLFLELYDTGLHWSRLALQAVQQDQRHQIAAEAVITAY